jgi:hypothetical protein
MFFTLLVPEECSASVEMREKQECSQSEYYVSFATSNAGPSSFVEALTCFYSHKQLNVYTILLGGFGLFERVSFSSVFSLFLAVIYTFIASVVLLNVLLAVASDSYDKCLIKSHHLFGRARVMMIAELVSFQNLMRRSGQPDQAASSSLGQLYTTWWSSDYSWARGWSRGSVVFFTLSSLVMVSWTIGEVVGYLVGARYGNISMSLGSVCVNVGLLCGIMLFLSTGASDGNNSKGGTDENDSKQHSKLCDEWYGRYFQNTMVRLLGSSGGKARLNGTEHMWQGRLHFLRNEMLRISNETKKGRNNMMRSLESMIQQSEARVRNEVVAVETSLNDLSRERREMNEQLQQLHGMISELLKTVRRTGPDFNQVD